VSGFGKPLHIRLFLEGIEVPVVAAQVSTHINGPAAAAIQVVPLDEVLRLKPRTMVHLFFREKPATEDSDTGKLENYRLLFTGEIVGFAWIQKANMRSVVLQCLDFSSYWDAATAAAIDYGPQGDAFTNQAALVGANVGIIDNVINFEAMKLTEWLKQTPETPGLQHVSGLAGGCIRILEALSGIRNIHRGINDFFTIGELRCRILEQICAEENDNTAYNLLKAKVFDEWVRQGLQNRGQQVSFRQIMILLFKYIYYDFVPNPTAKYDAAIEGETSKTTQPVSILKISTVSNAVTQLDAIQADIRGKLRSSDAAKGQAGAFIKSLQDIATALKARAGGFPSVQKALGKIDSTIALLKDVQQSGSGENLQAINDVGTAANDLRSASEVREVTSVKSTTTSARLRSHILRPDCWFAPPPRCNVIFPEHYTDLSYDRTFISECTRMLLLFHNTLVGQDILLATKILAPSTAAEAKLIVGAQGASSYRLLMKHELHTGVVAKMDMVPNTIAPVSDKTRKDDANQIAGAKLSWGSKIALFSFFKERFASRQASVSGRFNPYVVCGFPGLVIKRPFIVTGMSDAENNTDDTVLAAVQDSAFAQEHGAPSQLLGMIHSVTHSISQDGGVTSISMNYVREHLGIDDEFLGVFARTTEGVKKRVRTILRLDDLRGTENPDLFLLVHATPQFDAPPKDPVIERHIDFSQVSYPQSTVDPSTGAIITTTQTKDVSRTTESTKEDPATPYVVRGKIDGIDRDLWVPVSCKLVPGSKGKYGTVIGVEVLDVNVEVLADGEGDKTFRAVAVYEEVTLSSIKTVAVEEIIRPDWFSPAYQNNQIGKKIYDPFFGTGSISDDITVDNGSTSVETGTVTSQDGESKDELLARLDTLDGQKTGASIEKAVNLISYLYGVAKEQGQDVDNFITQYTHRPIAGLADMLGDNVTYTVDGTTATPEAEIEDQPFKVGFHTHAVHTETASRGNLVGLLDDPTLKLKRVNDGGQAGQIPESYDVRNEKWERVLAYFEAIRSGPGGFRG
jgi:hypothetical protein